MATKKTTRAGQSKASAAQRERLFVENYISNGQNGSQAAIAAGYSEKTAKQIALQVLRRPHVRQMLNERREALAKKHELTSDAVIRELARIVHFDPRKMLDSEGDLLPMKDWPDEVAAAVASFEVEEIGEHGVVIGRLKKVKVWDKNSAIEKAMKHLGLFEKDNGQQQPVILNLNLGGRGAD